MATFGTLIGGAIGGFGKKPRIPNFTPINAANVQNQTVSDNLAALPGIKKLVSSTNALSLEELRKAMEFAVPGGFSKAQSLISSQLSGELDPQDTQALIRNTAASSFGSGIQRGGFGSIGRNLTLRDIGRAGVEQRERGFTNFLSLADRTQGATLNPSSMFFTPQQRLTFAQQERDNQFNRDLLAEQVAASPDPFMKGLTQALINDENQMMQMAGNLFGLAG